MSVTAVALTERLMPVPLRPSIHTTTHCVAGDLPSSFKVDDGSYTPGSGSDMTFSGLATRTRVGVFDVSDAASGTRRGFLLFLPDGTPAPQDVLYGILPPLFQISRYWSALHAELPVADNTLRDVLSQVGLNDSRPGLVKAHFVQQAMSCTRRNYALVVPVRSLTSSPETELGPFVSDGATVRGALDAIARASGDAFAPQNLDAFAHSAGAADLSRLLAATAVRHVISIDPSPSIRPAGASGVTKCYVSDWVRGAVTHAGGRAVVPAGVEYLPISRWRNEPTRRLVLTANFHGNENAYLHNWAFPRYLLRVGLQAT